MLRRIPPSVLVFGLVAIPYLLTIPDGVSVDVWSANLASWHIGTTGSPVIDLDRFPTLADNAQRFIWVVQRPDGTDVVGRAPGTIAVAVPAYAVAGAVGWRGMSITPGGVTSALITAASVTLLFATLRPHQGARIALVAALVFGLTTPVWSVAADGVWPHTLTVLGILGMAWAADRERWWLVGLFGGVALWGRLHAAVICAVVGLLVAAWRGRPAIAAQVAAASGAMLVAMMAWNHWFYGRWSPTSAYDADAFVANARQSPLDVVNHLGLWVSPGRGMLVWSPLLLVLLPALVRGWRMLPDWSRALAVGGIVYTLGQLTLSPYKGGEGFFGYRIGLELLACSAPALALSAQQMGRIARRLFAPLCVLQFAVFGLGALADPRTAPRISNRWDSNELWSRLTEQTSFVAPILAGGIVIGMVVVRMWGDDEVWRGRRAESVDR